MTKFQKFYIILSSIYYYFFTEYPVKSRLFKNSGFIMIRLFFIILTMFVFSLPSMAQVRFYRVIQDGASSFFGLGDVKAYAYALCHTRQETQITAYYSSSGRLKEVKIENKGFYTQTYPANKSKFFPLDDYDGRGLLYTDGNVCEVVKERERTLLKIKDVRLCTVYADYYVDLGTNWTFKQFSDNAVPTGYQLDFWSVVYLFRKNVSLTTTAISDSLGSRVTISVLEVTFTNGQKVKLKIYDDPAWANAEPGMLVERSKFRQITVYKLR